MHENPHQQNYAFMPSVLNLEVACTKDHEETVHFLEFSATRESRLMIYMSCAAIHAAVHSRLNVYARERKYSKVRLGAPNA